MGDLIELQARLRDQAEIALEDRPWAPAGDDDVGGCFIAFARGEAGPGRPGDRAWAGAVVWRPLAVSVSRRGDHHLRGAVAAGRPRRADDVLAQSVVAGRVAAAYERGLLARREGPLLATAVAGLDLRPDVLLVDASGRDHPRRAGVAVHLGAALDLPTVGVTRRPLVARGSRPELQRGAVSPLEIEGDRVAYWVCTRSGAQPIVAHAGWRTSPETAAGVVLAASTAEARTPVPLQEARRVAREARALAGAG